MRRVGSMARSMDAHTARPPEKLRKGRRSPRLKSSHLSSEVLIAAPCVNEVGDAVAMGLALGLAPDVVTDKPWWSCFASCVGGAGMLLAPAFIAWHLAAGTPLLDRTMNERGSRVDIGAVSYRYRTGTFVGARNGSPFRLVNLVFGAQYYSYGT